MRSDYIEDFLESVNSESFKSRGEKKRILKVALEGKNPCKVCSKNKKCTTPICVPFYISFKQRWQRLQKALLIEG